MRGLAFAETSWYTHVYHPSPSIFKPDKQNKDFITWERVFRHLGDQVLTQRDLHTEGQVKDVTLGFGILILALSL